MDKLIQSAIGERKLIKFDYQGYNRIAEPHILGLKDGVPQLLVYQIRGGSRSGALPNWRRVNLAEMSSFQVLNETFAGPRTTPTGKHSEWDRKLALVE